MYTPRVCTVALIASIMSLSAAATSALATADDNTAYDGNGMVRPTVQLRVPLVRTTSANRGVIVAKRSNIQTMHGGAGHLAAANTWYVDTEACIAPGTGSAQDPFCTIQAGINAAEDGDVVLVADGTYTDTGNENITFGGKAITVQSIGGPQACSIERDSYASFRFENGERASSILSGFTINGNDEWTTRAAIAFENHSSPTIENCHIVRNHNGNYNSTPTGGGVICLDQSNPHFVDCVFAGNKALINDGHGFAFWADGYGGAVYAHQSSPSFSGCVFEENRCADDGGAIYATGGSITVEDCLFRNNVAYHTYTEQDYDYTIRIYYGNGGAIAVAGAGHTTVTRCLMLGNEAGEKGGAIYATQQTDVSNCVLARGQAHRGGAIAGTITAENCTMVLNEVGPSGQGGSVEVGLCGASADGPTLSNCILWHNRNRISGAHTQMCNTMASYCNIQGGAPISGCINEEPAFADADNDDYRLVAGSPGIDAGDPDFVPAIDEVDLDGQPRVADGDGDGTATVDMGAYELPGPICGDGILDDAEECDDGNTVDGDGCSSTCHVEWQTWYVDTEACTAPGTGSAEDPFCTIQAGINAAEDGDAVLVADGTYVGDGNVNINFAGKAIVVRSTGGPTQCIIRPEDEVGIVFNSGEGPASMLSGFTITGTDRRHALRCEEGSSPLIENCHFTHNETCPYDELCSCEGGAVFVMGGQPQFVHCLFAHNAASCLILDEEGPFETGYGGAVYVNSSHTRFTNCVFQSNYAGYSGGAVHIAHGEVTFLNCTFHDNTAIRYGGAINANLANVTITNTILCGGGSVRSWGSELSIRHSCTDDEQPGDGNIVADPLFGPDLRLLQNSPCIDAGDNAHVTVTTDLAGLPRVVDGDGDGIATVDMGAYEHPEPTCGDGIVDDSEECDDGNHVDGDGCSSTCHLEWQTWYVDTEACIAPGTGSAQDPFCTIQAGINAAENGDVVLVADGTYTDTGNENITFDGKAITVQSIGGPQACSIERDDYASFRFENGEQASSILSGFTINGNDQWTTRAAIAFENHSSPTIENCHIIRNTNANYDSTPTGGGVICLEQSNPHFVDCVFADNKALINDGHGFSYWADGYGGAVYASQSSPSFTGCVFEENRCADNGGAIYATGGSITVEDCLFRNNVARHTYTEEGNAIGIYYGNGGAIAVAGAGHTTVARCLMLGNEAGERGGAIYATQQTDVSNCVLARGQAHRGGAIAGTITAETCTMVLNEVGPSGYGGSVEVGLCGASADGPTLTNCILWYNRNRISGAYTQLCNTIASYCNIQGSIPIGHCINEEPAFADADNDDYRLVAGSPGIDAGDPDFVPDPGETDLAGHPRMRCGQVDMGAYEFGMPGDIDCDGVTDLTDFAEWTDCMTDPRTEVDPFPLYDETCADLDVDADGDIDLLDLAGFQNAMLDS